MTKAIRLTISAEQLDILAVFGFGSHFRGEPYNDVDILVVLKPGCGPLLGTYYNLKSKLEMVGRRFGVTIDLTVLTSEEFAERPLRDMDSLVAIYRELDSWHEASVGLEAEAEPLLGAFAALQSGRSRA